MKLEQSNTEHLALIIPFCQAPLIGGDLCANRRTLADMVQMLELRTYKAILQVTLQLHRGTSHFWRPFFRYVKS